MPAKPIPLPHPKIGKWAICNVGRVGRIDSVEDDKGVTVYRGVKLDGTPWVSKSPRIISDHDQTSIEATYRRSFIKVMK